MKLRAFPISRLTLPFASAIAVLLAALPTRAAQLYWDGGTVNIGTNGNGVSGGSAGNWNTTLTNWDQGNALAHVAWDNANLDTAVFGGTAGAVTLTAPVTVGGLTFFSTSGYTVTGSTLTLGAADNAIRLINSTNVATSSATITSSLVGTGNVILSSISPTVASTLNLNAGVGAGWSGTTTINAGMTLAMTGDGTGANGGRALANSTGITLNGGAIAITSDNSQSNQRATTRVSDTAAITSNGGTISLAISTISSADPVSETYGSVALTSGQLNVTLSSARSASFTSIILSDLTRTGASNTSAVAFARAATTTGTNIIRVNAVTTNTTAGQIIGPWATTGNTASQSDYAVYSGGDGTVTAAGIAASNQSTWTTATNAFTANASLGSGAITLSGGTKNITALRSITASSAVTATNATDVINLAAHTYVNGDAFVFNNGTAPTGLALNTPYFVVGAAANTFQLSATQGGAAINFTTDGTGLTGLGALLVSTGNNLGTTGILNASANTMYIAATGTGVVTLPTTTADNLHVNAGTGPIQIFAPITNNTGALTLVKNGAFALTLSGVNTYTGGTVVNAGTLNWSNANQLGNSGSRNLSVNGIATLNGNDGTSLDALSVGSGGLANFITAAYTFTSTTGSGVVSYRPTTATNRTLNLGNASSFTGTVQALMGGGTNTNPNVQFSSIGDGVGSALQFGGGSLDSTQGANFTLNGAAPLVFNNRQVQILMRISGTNGPLQNNLFNNSALAANTWIINTDLSVITNQTGRNFNLRGTNTGLNAFNGVISDGNFGGTVNLTKQDVGTWGLGGNNTHSGGTSLTGGKLNINHAGALGTGTFTIGTATFDNTSGSPITNSNNNAIAWNGDSTFTGTNALNLGTGAVTLGGNRNLTVSASTLTVGGAIGGAFNITKSGAGTLIFSGTSGYTGTTTASFGTLAGTNAVQSFGTNLSGISIGGSGTLSLRNDSSVSFTNGTTAYNIANSASGATINVDRVTGTGSNTITVGNLTTTSTAATWGLNFTGANGVSLSADALNTPASTLAAVHTITNNIAGGGSLTLASVFNQASTVASPDLIFTGTGNTIVSGSITQTLASMDLIKNGGGTLTLGGTNTFTGSTNVNGGTLQLGNGSSAGDLSGTSSITVTGATLSVNRNNAFTQATDLNNKAITGTGGFTQAGSGTTTLSLTNTFAGATNVTGGILAISGSGSINSSSAINVSAGAKLIQNSSTALTVSPTLNGAGTGSRAVLGGTGTINSAVTLDNLGDTLAPGNSPGIQNFTPAQTWSSFSYDWEMNDFTGTTAGDDFDQIGLSSTLSLSGGSGSYILNVLGLTALDAPGLVPNFTETNRDWIILTSAGITGFNAANWTLNLAGFTDPYAGTWSLGQSGNNLVLSYAVPEPSALLLGSLGLLALLRRRR